MVFVGLIISAELIAQESVKDSTSTKIPEIMRDKKNMRV